MTSKILAGLVSVSLDNNLVHDGLDELLLVPHALVIAVDERLAFTDESQAPGCP